MQEVLGGKKTNATNSGHKMQFEILQGLFMEIQNAN